MRTYRVGSLFAGVGGVCLGFKQARIQGSNSRFELAWANEIDEYACETYRTNFNHNLIQGDIVKILNPEVLDDDIDNAETDVDRNRLIEEQRYYEEKHAEILRERIDVLLGGFPCQAFSIAGARKGFDDDRGNLFLSIIELIKQLDSIHGKPKVLFLENVKNLQSHDNGRTYRIIKNELEKIGYKIKEHVLNTMDYSNLPQNRERIYIVGFLDEEDANRFNFFDRLEEYRVNRTEEERINCIINIIDYNSTIEELGDYYYTRKKYPNYFLTEAEYNKIPITGRKAERINLDEQITEMYEFYQVRRGMYVRKNMSGVCPTLTANMGTGGHNVPLIRVHDGIRKITPQEAFKLQGFPIGDGYILPTTYRGRTYSKSHLYKQAGNAVSVPIIELLAKEILKVIG